MSKFKTAKQKELDKFKEINYVKLEINTIKKSLRKKQVTGTIEIYIVYKKRTYNINNDEFLLRKIRKRFNIKENIGIFIKNISIIKKIGDGLYEKEIG